MRGRYVLLIENFNSPSLINLLPKAARNKKVLLAIFFLNLLKYMFFNYYVVRIMIQILCVAVKIIVVVHETFLHSTP